MQFAYDRSRTRERVKNRLGVIFKGNEVLGGSTKMQYFMFRRPELHLLDEYLTGTQYDHLPLYVEKHSVLDERKRQPKHIFPLPEIASSIVNGLLTSDDSRLRLTLEDTDKNKKFNDAIDEIKLWPYFNNLIPSLMCNGSAFLKIYSSPMGKIRMRFYNSKSCWPIFNEEGGLSNILIRYIFDTGTVDDKGDRIFKWSQHSLGPEVDVEYDNPTFNPALNDPPEFKIVNRIEHNLGFVQGVWLTTTIFNNENVPDGESYIADSLSFLDSLNYRLSKEDGSIFYNILPFLQAFGMDSKDLKHQYKEETQFGFKILATGRPPDKAGVNFVESSLNGLQLAEAFDLRMLQMLQYILKTVLLDPEKIASHAQSAKAMEALHKPVIQYIKKIRPQIKNGICEALYVVEQLVSSRKGSDLGIELGDTEKAEKKWGEIFGDTPQDIAQKVGYSTTAVSGKILSRRSALKHVAPNFGVEDVDEEEAQIEKETKQEFEDQRLFDEMTQPPTQPKPKPTGEKTSVKA